MPLWAELDAKAASDDDRLLEIHPAVPLREGATYAVALRSLVANSGGPVEPTALFRIARALSP